MRVSAAQTKSPISSDSEASSEEAPRKAQGSSEDNGSDDDESGSEEDKDDMLAALEAYNRSIFGFGGAIEGQSAVTGKAKGKGKAGPSDSEESAQDEGGAPIRDDLDSGSVDSEDDEEGDFYDEDDEFEGIDASAGIADESIPTVVYADTGSNTLPKVSKADYKRFMVNLTLPRYFSSAYLLRPLSPPNLPKSLQATIQH